MLTANLLPEKIESHLPPFVFVGPATHTKYAIIRGVWIDCDDTITTEMLQALWERPVRTQEAKPESGELTVEVKSSTGKGSYTVEYKKSQWSCTCPAFGFRRKCKHIDQVKSKK
tara:strand:+ start:232 stop:573 length:342 start_codon:yes stop_codon:yes gene_type:complete